MKKTKADFLQEKREMQQQHKRQIKLIEHEMKERRKLLDEKIGLRDDMLKALKGEKQARNAIKDLFKQEKLVKKEQTKKLREREQHEINRIMNFNEIAALFKEALHSTEEHESRRSHE
jgi:hypothetical protein